MLIEQFSGVEDIQVIWDRRKRGVERRELARAVEPERRGQERRRPQDRRSPAAEYLIVNVAGRVEPSSGGRR
jgi:hypothetical protein